MSTSPVTLAIRNYEMMTTIPKKRHRLMQTRFYFVDKMKTLPVVIAINFVNSMRSRMKAFKKKTIFSDVNDVKLYGHVNLKPHLKDNITMLEVATQTYDSYVSHITRKTLNESVKLIHI